MFHGIINVYKEPGYTSFDVVAKLRVICGQKKIGHTGTLDPAAEGVLPVCLGKATKVCDMLTDTDKIYRARLVLGIRTDTLDTTGEVLETKAYGSVTGEQIEDVIHSFEGNIFQTPPMYSALKVNGQKLCDLARRGITVERKARPVTIYSIEIVSVQLPDIEIVVTCSKGTYIRTLIDDIGQKLGCGAAMSHLVREKTAGFRAEDALRLDEIREYSEKGILESCIHPIDELFSEYSDATVTEQAQKWLYNGNALDSSCFLEIPDQEHPVRVYDGMGVFCGIYQYQAEKKEYKPVKMFLI